MRPDSKQLRILKALTAHLEFINPDNPDPFFTDATPYDLDLRGKVKRGRTQFGRETVAPFLALLESPQPADGIPADDAKTKRKEMWRILLQGFADDDIENPTDPAYGLKAVVEMRLARIVSINNKGDPSFPGEYLLGKSLIGLTIGQGVVRPPDDKVSSRAFFYIPLVIELSTDVTNPYA